MAEVDILMQEKQDDGSYNKLYPITNASNVNYTNSSLSGVSNAKQGLDSIVSTLGNINLNNYFTKTQTLTTATAALFGLGADSVPDDGFALLSRLNSGLGNEYLWEKTKVTTTFEYENRTNTSVSVGLSLWISNSVELVDGVVTMVSPQKLTVEASEDFVAKLTNVYLTLSGVFQDPWFCTSAGYSALSITLYYYSEVKAVTTTESFGYVNSSSPDAYPPAEPDGYTYTALGQLGNKVQIATGSYTGTGTYGSRNPNSLTFGFEPKIVFISYSGKGQENYQRAVFNCFAIDGLNGFTNYGYSYSTGNTYPNYSDLSAKKSGKQIIWFSGDASRQLNLNSVTYKYFAIG